MSLSGYIPEAVTSQNLLERLVAFAISMLPDVGFWASTIVFAPNDIHRSMEQNRNSSYGLLGKMQVDIMSMRNFGVGFASYLVWKEGGGFEESSAPLVSYATLMVLFWSSQPVLFRSKSKDLRLAHSIATTVSAVTTTVLFWRVTRRASVLMIPFLAHLSFTALRHWVCRDRKRRSFK
ncbi:hypothetical protein GE061_011125 [Apolygus lucorum]|uniref:Uncharacterized protein n=1 Tax=Apolygus lucorum TaxID=248454 RepID=A0A6A4JCC3_APOLU|nr:hypothetical protein GE061_011125 [Apolygus lucorum]